LGETAYLTVAIQKKPGLKFTWRDSTAGWGNDDMVAYKRGYTCNSAEFESIELHDAYWENAIGNYNRQYVIALADSRMPGAGITDARNFTVDHLAGIPAGRTRHIKSTQPKTQDNDSNTAPADVTADQGAETVANLETVDSLPATPLPYTIIPTSGSNLECGLYALINSIRAIDAGEFTGEVSLLVEALRAVPYGWAFIIGGLGSGKITTAMSLVRAVTSGSTNVAVVVEHAKKDGDDDDDAAETAAETAAKTPLPYTIIPTSGSNLECGLYALINSIRSQLPSEAPPSIDELHTILNSPDMLQRMSDAGVTDMQNLTVDHVAGVLQIWGQERGLSLQLGCFLGDSDAVGQILFPSDFYTTV
jgi:hypothetical protein